MKVLKINRKDLKHNINVIKNFLKKEEKDDDGRLPKIIGVVKGNGYGLGLIEFSQFLINNGITILAVSSVEEALELREAGIDNEILLLGATAIKADVEKLVDNNITITISSFDDLTVLNKILENKNKKQKISLKLDTGFNRYGFKIEELEELIEKLKKSENVEISGTFSHFSFAYAKENKYVKKQFDNFINGIEKLKKAGIDTGMLHICNSCAFFKYPEMHLNAVRIGSAFLGRLPMKNIYGLKRIGNLCVPVSEIKTAIKGETVGYSNTVTMKKDTKIAIVQAGYIDGLNFGKFNDTFGNLDKIRILKNTILDIFKDKHIYYYINDKKCMVVGKIGMNHVALDITGKDIKIGDKVEISISPLNVNSKIRREYE